MRGYLPRLLLCVVVALLVGGSVVAQTQQSPGFVLNLPTTSGGEISIISSLSTATSSLGPIVVAGNRTSERAGPIDSGAVYTYVPRTTLLPNCFRRHLFRWDALGTTLPPMERHSSYLRSERERSTSSLSRPSSPRNGR